MQRRRSRGKKNKQTNRWIKYCVYFASFVMCATISYHFMCVCLFLQERSEVCFLLTLCSRLFASEIFRRFFLFFAFLFNQAKFQSTHKRQNKYATTQSPLPTTTESRSHLLWHILAVWSLETFFMAEVKSKDVYSRLLSMSVSVSVCFYGSLYTHYIRTYVHSFEQKC